MPTIDEFVELYVNATYSWTLVDAVWGGEVGVTDSPSGYLFLPAAGFYFETLMRLREYGTGWSSSVYGGDYGFASAWFVEKNYFGRTPVDRYTAYSVRGILDP